MGTRWRRQDGASAVIVAIALLLLFGAGAIAVDLGSAWETKRDLIIDTDAGALAAARAAAVDGCTTGTAEQAALDFMSANLGAPLTAADIDLQCVMAPSLSQPNTVKVSLTQAATQTLSHSLGVESLDVLSSSTATYNGFRSGRMRPLALCNLDPQIASYVPPGASGPLPADVIISMGKTWKDPACGGGDGNWGYLCFDAANCSEGDIKDLMEFGHPLGVDLGTAMADGSPHPYNPPAGGTDEDCRIGDGTATDWCEIRSGSALSDNTPDATILDFLVGQTFSVLVSDCIGQLDATDTCIAGSNSATFVHPYAIAYVTMHAWCHAKNNVAQSKWHPADAGYTNAQCHGAASENGDMVFGFTLHGVTSSGTPRDFINFEDPRAVLCGVDHDTVGHRCERP